MSEESRNVERPRTHQPQPPAVEGPLPLREQLSRSLQDNPKSRRTLLGALAAGGMTLAGFGTKEILQKNIASANPEDQMSHEKEKLNNDFVYLMRDRDGNLTYADKNIAQYYDVTLAAVLSAGNEEMTVKFRDEPTVESHDVIERKNHQLRDLTFGVIRAGAESNNYDVDDFFIGKDNQPVYEWLIPVRRTGDEEKPLIYIDGYGNESDKPWFVSPNFASLDTESMDMIKLPSATAQE